MALGGAGAAARGGSADTIGRLEDAVAAYEKSLLEELFPRYPSTRKLAERLGTSHSAIAQRLRRYGIGPTSR